MVRADRGEVERPEALRRLARRDAGKRLGAFVEGQRRHDRKRRDAPGRVDRGLELVELVERLDHENVYAAAVEHLGLFGEDLRSLLPRQALGVAERTDRACDEDVASGDLARLARQLHAGAVDPLQVVLEVELGQLAPVGAEGVRLDQVRARADEARVKRHDAFGRLEVRLLGTAQARDGARDEHAHPAVADDDRAIGQTLFESTAHGVDASEVRSSTEYGG
jgi:hypothetical protein